MSTFPIYLMFLIQSGLTMKRNISMLVNQFSDTTTNNGFQIGEKQEHRNKVTISSKVCVKNEENFSMHIWWLFWHSTQLYLSKWTRAHGNTAWATTSTEISLTGIILSVTCMLIEPYTLKHKTMALPGKFTCDLRCALGHLREEQQTYIDKILIPRLTQKTVLNDIVIPTLLFICITDNGNVLKRAPREKHTASSYVCLSADNLSFQLRWKRKERELR